ncbi:MAG: hypothetical protein KOO63_02590 [Bacteroidales bacterium]|nr:hypothetical protein [Candidatus Latescibacterota bacterium]
MRSGNNFGGRVFVSGNISNLIDTILPNGYTTALIWTGTLVSADGFCPGRTARESF